MIRWVAVAVGLAAALSATAPASADNELPDALVVADATPVAAYASHLVFSRADGAGGFELVQRVNAGPVERLPVPSRAVPFG